MKNFSHLWISTLVLAVACLSACTSVNSSEPADRTIAFEGIGNARELGGLTMQDGSVVRKGMLVRSAHLAKASDADVALLQSRFNLSDVFDFRMEMERTREMDRAMEGVTNTWLSTMPEAIMAAMSAGSSESGASASASVVDVLVKYSFAPQAQEAGNRLYPAIVMDPTSQERYGQFLHGVLQAKGGALWHCSQGKDRCGWGSAFVLAALGASRETIVEDFALSNVSYAADVQAAEARVLEMGGGDAELNFVRTMVGVNVENFEHTLDLIDAQYGSLQNYLETALGFTAEEQQQMKQKYTSR